MQPNVLKKHVFISYARPDGDFARRLAFDLERANIPVWIDAEALIPGTPDWEGEIRKAISEAYAVLILASPETKESVFVHAELALALEAGIRIFPFWVSGDLWIDSIPLAISKTQYLDGRDKCYSESLKLMLDQLRNLIESSTPKRAFVKNVLHDRSGSETPLAYPSYIAVLLSTPWWRSRNQWKPESHDLVLLNPREYRSLQQMLDDLYVYHLQDRFEPLTYGSSWLLLEYNRIFNPSRIVAPWEWILN